MTNRELMKKLNSDMSPEASDKFIPLVIDLFERLSNAQGGAIGRILDDHPSFITTTTSSFSPMSLDVAGDE